MTITEVRATLIGDGRQEGLLAYCSITIDAEFVVHDVKLVRISGRYLVSMPSRRITAPCQKCRETNHMRAKFCNRCGNRFVAPAFPCLDTSVGERQDTTARYYVDVAHPVRKKTREDIEAAVLAEYHREVKRVSREIPAGA